MKEGAALLFAHGLNIHFNLIEPRKDLDILMVAPKGPGHTVRGEYKRGAGVPCLIAIHQDATGNAQDIALVLCLSHWWRTCRHYRDKFSRRMRNRSVWRASRACAAALSNSCGPGFETLVEAGYAPEMAYFECVHEMKLIVDLIYEGGMANMNYSISNTAEYGEYVSGPRVITKDTKAAMKDILDDIQNGKFVKDWMVENKVRQTGFKAMRKRCDEHPVEEVGAKLRAMMPWIAEGRMVDKEKN